MGLLDIFKRKSEADENTAVKKTEMPDQKRIARWNLFIEDVCNRELVELSDLQKKAVLCFWYDAEVNSGGHCGYFDCYPDTDPQELADALRTVATEEMAQNYLHAVSCDKDESGCWEAMDDNFYGYAPSLCEYIEDYVEEHRGKMFARQPNTVQATWGWCYDWSDDHEKNAGAPEMNAYSHIAIYFRWMTEHDLLSEEVKKRYPDLKKNIEDGKIDVREFLKKTADFRGMICVKHFSERGQIFSERFYDFQSDKGYPSYVNKYANEYFKQDGRSGCAGFQDEKYLFVPYDENYYMQMSKYIDEAWDRIMKKPGKDSSKAEEYREAAIEVLKNILTAMHEKRYGDISKYVDEFRYDNNEAVFELVEDRASDAVDGYGAPCNFDPPYEYSQLNIYMSDDGSGFKLDYDLTTGSELMDLSLQLEFLYTDKGLKSIFITVDPQ